MICFNFERMTLDACGDWIVGRVNDGRRETA